MKQVFSYKLNQYIAALCITFVSFGWLFFFNRYHIIGFHADTQLFRVDYLYFQSYLNKPGGLIDYLGSFLIQFYYYPWLGALIISLISAHLFLLFSRICGQENTAIQRLFIFPATLSVLFLIVCSDMYLHLTYVLAVWFVLVCMTVYRVIPAGTKRYVAGVLGYLITYFITGGNAILFVALVVLFEWFDKTPVSAVGATSSTKSVSPEQSGSRKQPLPDQSFTPAARLSDSVRLYGYLLGLIVLSLVTPYLAHLFIYTATLKNTYLSFTPFLLNFANKIYTTAWIAVPALYFVSLCLKEKRWLQYTKPWKIFLFSYILFAVGLFLGLRSVYEPEMEQLSHIEYEAERGKWEKVLALSEKYADSWVNNALVVFYTNMALSEMGLLSSEMFHYDQTGNLGLFLEWMPTHFTPWHTGEQYYRLGVLQEAEHCAYETMMANQREYGARPLRRLVKTTLLRKDKNGFEKYIRLFEKSPMYRHWAKQQRAYYEAQKNVAGTQHQQAKDRDFFLNHKAPERNLIYLMSDNPKNRKVFETLTASALLQKQLHNFLTYMDKFYTNVGYPQMPRHFEEAILICTYGGDKSLEKVIERYPVSRETTDDFMQYTQLARGAGSQAGIAKLKEKYGHTYWYYYLYADPQQINPQVESPNRY